jgi:hypothetical protein
MSSGAGSADALADGGADALASAAAVAVGSAVTTAIGAAADGDVFTNALVVAGLVATVGVVGGGVSPPTSLTMTSPSAAAPPIAAATFHVPPPGLSALFGGAASSSSSTSALFAVTDSTFALGFAASTGFFAGAAVLAEGVFTARAGASFGEEASAAARGAAFGPCFLRASFLA